jgi:helix-turn-helix protein
MPDRSDPLDTTEETARRLRRAPQTLARWRCEGSGPAYVKVGNRVLYPRPDVDAWIAGRRVMPHRSRFPSK